MNQLLDLSKLDSGKLSLELSEGNLERFINAVAGSFESLAEKKDIKYEINVTNGHLLSYFDKDKVEAYDEHLMQLAAYRVGLGLPEAQCANVFVSRRVAGLTKMIEWTERDLQRGFRMFTNLLQFWQERNQHK